MGGSLKTVVAGMALAAALVGFAMAIAVRPPPPLDIGPATPARSPTVVPTPVQAVTPTSPVKPRAPKPVTRVGERDDGPLPAQLRRAMT